jgi:hypothetical protein
MALNVPDVGENVALENFVNKTAPQNLVLRLFKNNITPSDTDTTATFTEAVFGGYVAINLTGATWGAAASGTITYGSQQTFTCNAVATDDIYGYYVNQVTSTILCWAERDASAPFAVRNSGDAYKVTPTISAN